MDTHVASLTPPGAAAIATVAVRGPLAWPMTQQLFRPFRGETPNDPPVGKVLFGTLGGEARDDVVLAVKDQGLVEVHCHGGMAVVGMIEELFCERGAARVSWHQFQDDPLYALLVTAPTTRTANILLDQFQGAWRAMLARDNPPLDRLASLIPLGQHLVQPWRVVIAGAPNVGKSSLMNALTGFTRSIVSPTPGSTRDVITTPIAIDGWPIELCDTAGLRDTRESLEREGIDRAIDAARNADLKIWLLDGSIEPVFPECKSDWLLVVNKCDLSPAWNWDRAGNALRLSAQTAAGLPELCELISKRLVPETPIPGEAVPCLPEQIAWVIERPKE